MFNLGVKSGSGSGSESLEKIGDGYVTSYFYYSSHIFVIKYHTFFYLYLKIKFIIYSIIITN